MQTNLVNDRHIAQPVEPEAVVHLLFQDIQAVTESAQGLADAVKLGGDAFEGGGRR